MYTQLKVGSYAHGKIGQCYDPSETLGAKRGTVNGRARTEKGMESNARGEADNASGEQDAQNSLSSF